MTNPSTFHGVPFVACGGRRRPRALAGIFGIPHDLGATARAGARLAPAAIRQASYLRGPLAHVDLGVMMFQDSEILDAGDVATSQSSVGDSLEAVAQHTSGVANMAELVIALGGDHSVTVPVVTELARRAGPLSLVVFDAHLDTWREEAGVDPAHGSMLHRCLESGAVRDGCLFGWRGYGPNASHRLWAQEHGFDVWSMSDIERTGLDSLVGQLAECLTGKIYISIDIDVVDPAHAPGTGTPEPGGLTSRELLAAIRTLAATTDVVGADVVEVCPPFDHTGVTAMLAHRCVLEIIAGASYRRASQGADISEETTGYGP